MLDLPATFIRKSMRKRLTIVATTMEASSPVTPSSDTAAGHVGVADQEREDECPYGGEYADYE